MSTAKKTMHTPAHHAPVRSHHAAEQKPHAAPAEAPPADVPAEETAEPVVAPPVPPPPPVEAVPAAVEPEPSAEVPVAPPEKSITDYFGCRCGDKRNLSMEGGVYRCHGRGTTHRAQTLESRKAKG